MTGRPGRLRLFIDRWLRRTEVVDYWRWRSTDRWLPGRGPER